jgi:hypothetical protein
MSQKPRMDVPTATAFAFEAFEKSYPREIWPVWMQQHVTPCCERLGGIYRVKFLVFVDGSIAGDCFFEVEVDAHTGATRVTIDEPFSKYTNGNDQSGQGVPA